MEGAVVREARGVAEVLGVLREEREVGVVAVAPGWAVGRAVGFVRARVAIDPFGSGPDVLDRVALGAGCEPAAGGFGVRVGVAEERPVCG